MHVSDITPNSVSLKGISMFNGEEPSGATCNQCACKVEFTDVTTGHHPLINWHVRHQTCCRQLSIEDCPNFIELLARYFQQALDVSEETLLPSFPAPDLVAG
jgi:hypothetical protein